MAVMALAPLHEAFGVRRLFVPPMKGWVQLLTPARPAWGTFVSLGFATLPPYRLLSAYGTAPDLKRMRTWQTSTEGGAGGTNETSEAAAALKRDRPTAGRPFSFPWTS